ncbi:MAG TPA: SRPBCC family protein [Terriglobales bacterium]|nr:SRPBCC family protein [Terriglobales bacterium]
MLKIALIIGAGLAGAVALIIVVGWMLPKSHTVSRSIILHQPPAKVFALISDFASAPAWRPDVRQVEILPTFEGRARFRETGDNGAITMEVVEWNPPRRLITRIADSTLPFGGTWTFDLAPAGDGCRLQITEQGEIYNPVFRFVSRFIIGQNRTLQRYLDSLERKLCDKGNRAKL